MVEQSSVARGNLNLLQSPIVDKINFVSMLKFSDTGRASWIRSYSFNQKFTMINNTKDSMHSMYPGYKQYIHVFIWMGSFNLTIQIVQCAIHSSTFQMVASIKTNKIDKRVFILSSIGVLNKMHGLTKNSFCISPTTLMVIYMSVKLSQYIAVNL